MRARLIRTLRNSVTIVLLTVILVIICSFNSRASAAEVPCPDKDLQAPANSPFRQIPIYDQDGSQICYAYAAAQLTDFALIKSGQKKFGLVNPVYAAWLEAYKTRKYTSRKTLTNGYSEDVLEAIRSTGFCSDLDARKSLADLRRAGRFTEAEAVRFIQFSFDAHEKSRSLMGWGPANPKWREIAAKDDESYAGSCSFKAASAWMDAKMLSGVATTEVLDKLFGHCSAQKPKLPGVRTLKRGTDADYEQEVNRYLNLGNPMSVLIGCFGTFADNPKTQPRAFNEKPRIISRNTVLNENACTESYAENHEIVVAGQRKIGGQCHYLLRNSFGTSWRGMGATECACINRSGKYQEACDEAQVKEYLGCWYKRSDVIQNTGEITGYE